MCRGGKDGAIRRCQLNERQHAAVNFRKKVKYRADKAGLSVTEWKTKNPELTEALVKISFPRVPSTDFQGISETRTLPPGVPESIIEHKESSKKYIDSVLSSDQKTALSGYAGFAAGICNTVLRNNGSVKNYFFYDKAPNWKEADGGPSDFSTKEELQDYIETMDGILSTRQQDSRVLYRGHPIYESMREQLSAEMGEEWIDFDDTELTLKALESHYPVGKVMHYQNYVSTSLSAFQAADRTQEAVYGDDSKIRGVLFEMKTNAGVDITGVSFHDYEREVVLPRDTSFIIKSVSLKPQSYDTVSGFDDKDDLEERCGKNFDNLAIVIQMVEVDNDGNEITHTNPHEPDPVNLH